MADRISIEKADGTWVVRAGGAVLGETENALILREEGYPFVVYFPRGDIAMAFLDQSEKTTNCPHKGEATYFSIQTKSVVLKDAAWSYQSPNDNVHAIAGHMAFMDPDVTVEQV